MLAVCDIWAPAKAIDRSVVFAGALLFFLKHKDPAPLSNISTGVRDLLSYIRFHLTSLQEVLHAVLEDRLELVAWDVLGDVLADAFAVAHLAEDAAVWTGEPFDGCIGAIDVVWHIEAGIAIHVDILGDDLVVGEKLFQRILTGDKTAFPMGERDLVGGADFHACKPW